MVVAVLDPSEYSHIINLTAPDGREFIGLTNNPNTVTNKKVIDKLFQNGKYNLVTRSENISIPREHHHIRSSSCKEYDDEYSTIDFNGKNYIKLDLVIGEDGGRCYPALNNISPVICDEPISYGAEQLLIKVLQGNTITINNVDIETATTNQLYQTVSDKTGVPADMMRLIYRKQLCADDMLVNYNIKHNSTIHMCLRLKGGMFHSTSGRDGKFGSKETIMFSIDK